MKPLLITSEFPHVFVPEESQERPWVKPSAKSSAWISVLQSVANWLIWVSQASIIRLEGPGHRSLKRHEFESVELSRGGFGRVF